ncbi:ATP-binding protein [Actinoplanes subglobosus]|uniref:ATP-binding protein n=1 Tax=Actinoplanes subglobosus TaxID=1547892 RepID=A0ABV8J9Y1_9ACTN
MRHAHLEQPFTGGDLYSLRSAVAAHMTPFSETLREAVMIVVGELASNVVRHGGASGTLLLHVEDDTAVCTVSDSGPGLPGADTVGTQPVPPQTLGGRGLWIIRRLCRSLDIVTGPDGTAITVTIDGDQLT